jgi:hypothetical protein
MIAFEPYVNGQKICTAGSEGLDALTTGITFSRPMQPPQREAGTYLSLGGAVAEREEFAHWHHSQLRVGDQVEIRIVETPKADGPSRREKIRNHAV